jgi:hypothetical protein
MLSTSQSRHRKQKSFLTLGVFFVVLRDVVRAECGDAQADGDLQTTGRHHTTGSSLPLRRGEIFTLLSCVVGDPTLIDPDPQIRTSD